MIVHEGAARHSRPTSDHQKLQTAHQKDTHYFHPSRQPKLIGAQLTFDRMTSFMKAGSDITTFTLPKRENL